MPSSPSVFKLCDTEKCDLVPQSPVAATGGENQRVLYVLSAERSSASLLPAFTKPRQGPLPLSLALAQGHFCAKLASSLGLALNQDFLANLNCDSSSECVLGSLIKPVVFRVLALVSF
jgi:hypothetical protein